MKYQEFHFKDYSFEPSTGVLSLTYGYDNALTFTETFKFAFALSDYDPAVLDRACQLVFFMCGVSYYKAYLAPKIIIDKGELDQTAAEFFAKTYQNGLGEFFYVNKLDPHTKVPFAATTTSPEAPLTATGKGLLLGVGGGKDSLVTIEQLRSVPDAATWSVNHRSQLEPLVEVIGLPHYWVERTWDLQLQELNKADAYNGHIPISAIFACVGTVTAILSGHQDVVVSNENSANEPTLHYQGVDINHQYSKSLAFEQDFQALLKHNFGDSLRYYSFLRPLSEVYIAELFAKTGFEKYKSVFSSCNRAFTHDSHHIFWCCHCPKCAFTFLAFTPFIEQAELEQLFGKNLLLDPELEPTYRQLLGIEGDKPLECVGEVKESRAAMHLAQKTYPELAKYQFELPDDYDYRALASHSMPADMYELLQKALL